MLAATPEAFITMFKKQNLQFDCFRNHCKSLVTSVSKKDTGIWSYETNNKNAKLYLLHVELHVLDRY